jgi:hypothetical protein
MAVGIQTQFVRKQNGKCDCLHPRLAGCSQTSSRGEWDCLGNIDPAKKW